MPQDGPPIASHWRIPRIRRPPPRFASFASPSRSVSASAPCLAFLLEATSARFMADDDLPSLHHRGCRAHRPEEAKVTRTIWIRPLALRRPASEERRWVRSKGTTGIRKLRVVSRPIGDFGTAVAMHRFTNILFSPLGDHDNAPAVLCPRPRRRRNIDCSSHRGSPDPKRSRNQAARLCLSAPVPFRSIGPGVNMVVPVRRSYTGGTW